VAYHARRREIAQRRRALAGPYGLFDSLVWALLALFGTMACAAEPALLPPVIVTGSQLPASEVAVSQSLVVLSESEVRQRAAATLPELLRGTSTLYVDQTGAPGGISSLYLRGADPSHTMVLIDGVKVSDPTNTRGGGLDPSLIDPRSLSRVEIMPGASSAVYGADAMAGVVNLITRDPTTSGLRLGAGAGGGGFRTAYASGALRAPSLAVAAHASTTSDGHLHDAAFGSWRTGSLRLNVGNPGERHVTAWVRGQHQESGSFPDDSGGPLFAVRRDLERRESDGLIGSITGETKTPWGALRIYTNAFEHDARVQSPGVAPGVRDPAGIPRNASDSRYRRGTIGTIAVFGTGAEAPALIGVQYEKEQGEVMSTLFFGPVRVPANFALERHTRSAFGEARVKLGEKLAGQAGVRADAMDAHGTHSTMQAGLTYSAAESARVAVNYGTGFKPPSFFALGHPIVGNRELQSETSRTLELSVSGDLPMSSAGMVHYRVAVFRSRYLNLVDFDAGPPPRLVNRDAVQIKGYEIAASSTIAAKLKLRAAATGLDIDVPAGAPPLRNRPELRATGALTYDMGPHVTAAVYGSWTSRVFDSAIPTGPMYLPPSAVVDGSLAYVSGHTRLALAIDNLLNKAHQQFIGFPARGRRARVELALEI
jgi:vitamin B12 transporter